MPEKLPQKKSYKKPELRVFGPMDRLTHTMWFGFYPDRLGRLQFQKPPNWMMMMGMNMS